MIDKKSKEPFSKENFENPPMTYRGTPFWAWNCKMTPEKIKRIIRDLKDMGMGGAYLHSRTGMDMPYLGEEFMEMIHVADEELKRQNMLTCLYDEDRWPSGYGGGYVTKKEEYRSRFLVFSPRILEEGEVLNNEAEASSKAVLSGKRRLLGTYDVELEDGWLKSYIYQKALSGNVEFQNDVSESGTDSKNKKWYAYLEICGDSPWFNNQSYVDTLNPKAIQEFINVTYEAYYRELGDSFGSQVPTIFTDEPQFSFKEQFGHATEEKILTIPYTDDLEDTYQKQYGDSFLVHLPEIFWDLLDNQVSVHRYRYHDHVCQRFTESFADQIGNWCKAHGIYLTGHMMREPFLEWQTMALGEAMRSYRSFGIPGIDILCDRRELTTAKQAQSAVHQFGAPGMTSEMYGVTNWDFDFRGHKLAGDWQAALGVTCRVHHLTWTSMAGEAKRDYPAPIGSQSPWYKEYRYVEDYFSRINTVLTRGKAVAKIGVIHPIESYWLYWGTHEHTDEIRQEREENFVNLVKWLLYGLMDFDFISESLLADFEQENKYGFQVGEMKYDVILVPDCVTLRESTYKRLEEFRNRGGSIIFAGEIPEYVDAKASSLVKTLAPKCQIVRYSKQSILDALKPWRILDIHNQDGRRSDNLLYQLRKEENDYWLFVAHSELPENKDLVQEETLTFKMKGLYQIEKFDTFTGKSCWQFVRYQNGYTIWEEKSYEYDSFLYHLEEMSLFNTWKISVSNSTNDYQQKEYEKISVQLPAQIPVTLSESNVLLLDRAEYAFDGGQWQEEEDILRIDNNFRRQLGLPLRTEAYAQPWVDDGKCLADKHTLHLRFHVFSEYKTENVQLALEASEYSKIWWNNKQVDMSDAGWYVDHDIRKVYIGEIKTGCNILELDICFDGKVPVENIYLLGNFGVQVHGKMTKITAPVKQMEFGDICRQGLPFYGGNITYHMDVELKEKSQLEIQVSRFRAPVISVSIDEEEVGHIAFSPYTLKTDWLPEGKHRLELTVFGNRVNTFGTIHNCNEKEKWIGPNAWRTEGISWSYEYCLKQSGILKAPVINIIKN